LRWKVGSLSPMVSMIDLSSWGCVVGVLLDVV
jgi:hypothetical protein